MLPFLLLLFIVVPLVELAVILQVGEAIGVWATIGLLVGDSVLGSLLMRAQGRAAWRRLAEATRAGRPPAREVLDGALILGGGALLLTPGFLTDVFGLLLLLPPTRAVIRTMLARRVMERMVAGMRSPTRSPRRRSPDIEGTAADVDPPEFPPPPGR